MGRDWGKYANEAPRIRQCGGTLSFLILKGQGQGVASGTCSGQLCREDSCQGLGPLISRPSGCCFLARKVLGDKCLNLTLFLPFQPQPGASNWPDPSWEAWGQGSLLLKSMKVSLLDTGHWRGNLQGQTEGSQHPNYWGFPITREGTVKIDFAYIASSDLLRSTRRCRTVDPLTHFSSWNPCKAAPGGKPWPAGRSLLCGDEVNFHRAKILSGFVNS